MLDHIRSWDGQSDICLISLNKNCPGEKGKEKENEGRRKREERESERENVLVFKFFFNCHKVEGVTLLSIRYARRLMKRVIICMTMNLKWI